MAEKKLNNLRMPGAEEIINERSFIDNSVPYYDTFKRTASSEAYSALDGFVLGFKGGFGSNFLNSLADAISKPLLNVFSNFALNEGKISPIEAKERYGVEVKSWNSPLYLGRMAQRRENAKTYNDLVQKYTQAGGSLAPFMVGTIGGVLTDPVMVGYGFSGSYLAMKGARLGMRAKMLESYAKVGLDTALKSKAGLAKSSKLFKNIVKITDSHFIEANAVAEGIIGSSMDYVFQASYILKGEQKDFNHLTAIGWGAGGAVLGGLFSILASKSLKQELKALEGLGAEEALKHIEKTTMQGRKIKDFSVDLESVRAKGDYVDKLESSDILNGLDDFEKYVVSESGVGAFHQKDIGVSEKIFDYKDFYDVSNKIRARGNVGKSEVFTEMVRRSTPLGKELGDINTYEPQSIGVLFSDRLQSYFNTMISGEVMQGNFNFDDFWATYTDSYNKAIDYIKNTEGFERFIMNDQVNPEAFDVMSDEVFMTFFGTPLDELGAVDVKKYLNNLIDRSVDIEAVKPVDAMLNSLREYNLLGLARGDLKGFSDTKNFNKAIGDIL